MKRQSLTLWLAIVLVMVLNCLTLRAVNTIIYNATYTYSASNLTIGTDTLDGVTYTTVSYNGLYNGGDPGMPSLPVDYIRFSVPWNATNFTVNALLQNNIIQTIDYRVYPCQRPWLMNDTTPTIITPPDSAAYFSNAYYPSQNAWVVNEGFLAGENHIVTVAVLPISYKRSGTGSFEKNQLKKSQTVRLTLSYQLKDSLPMYPIARQDSALRREGYALTQSMVANPTNVETFAPINLALDSLIYINPPSGDGLNGGIDPPNPPISNDSITNGPEEMGLASYPYLIVTTNELVHSVRRIAALKRQKGYGVKVVTMNEVLSSPLNFGGDRIRLSDSTYHVVDSTDAGKLRQFLKYYYSKYGTQFVLLVGNGIPYKTVPNTYNDPKHTFDIISDLYYSDLSANWNSNNNIDYDPELYVGRIISHSENQINNYTDKLFRYELNPGAGNASYLKNAFFLRGRDFTDDGDFPIVTRELNAIFPNQNIIIDTIGSISKHPNGVDIINNLNTNRVGFASILNHSDSTRIRVYGKDKDQTKHFIFGFKPEKDGDELNSLTNKSYPMVFYAPTCATIPFDFQGGLCFGESFTTGQDYGGPVYIGHTRTVYNIGTMPLFKRFSLRIKEGYYQLGIADALSKGVYRWDVTCNEIMSHAFLGDPSLELWTDEPLQFSNISVSRSNNSITISGIDVDTVPTIVAYYYRNVDFNNSDGRYFRKVSTTSSSVTLNNAYPNGVIMVYKHNYLPFIAPLFLQNEDMDRSQYIIATDVTAGYSVDSVDSIRTSGSVTIKNGAEYEIEASGTVTLHDGFSVEKGATFAVYPSSF